MRTKTTINKNLSINEIMEKYNIPRTTAWRAKQSGYFYGSSYHDRDDCKATPKQTANFLRICSTPCITVAGLKSVHRQKPIDIASGRSTLTCGEWKEFKQEIRMLQDFLRSFIHSKDHAVTIQDLKRHPLIKFGVMFAEMPTMIGRLSNNLQAYDDELTQARKIARALVRKLQVTSLTT